MRIKSDKEGAIMKTKRGRNPNRKEKIMISFNNLNSHNWLIVDTNNNGIVIRHKTSGTERFITAK